jgi:hypothetical protein
MRWAAPAMRGTVAIGRRCRSYPRPELGVGQQLPDLFGDPEPASRLQATSHDRQPQSGLTTQPSPASSRERGKLTVKANPSSRRPSTCGTGAAVSGFPIHLVLLEVGIDRRADRRIDHAEALEQFEALEFVLDRILQFREPQFDTRRAQLLLELGQHVR